MATVSRISSPVTRPAFIIVDPSLRDFVGHHHAYDSTVAHAAGLAGFRAVVLGHRDAIPAVAEGLELVRCFRRDIWGRHPWAAPFVRDGLAGLPGRLLDHLLCLRDFAADLRQGLAGIETPPGSIMLPHMVTSKHLGGLAQVLEERAAAGQPIQTIILMRYQAMLYDNPVGRRGLRRLEALAAAGLPIRLASDSDRLADSFAGLTSLAVETLPIPHPAPEPAAPPPPGPLRLASLGGARDEKGMFEIIEAIRLLRAEPAGLAGLRFTLQANDAAPDVQAALDGFAADLPDEVTLLPRALGTAEYHAALHDADMLLLPYWRSIYEARTSGVFLEALAAGKPVIATADSWMSDELAQYGAGIEIPDRDAPALARAIRQAARDQAALTARAMADRGAVLARHSAAALVSQCVDGPPARPATGRPRITMVFPWGDLLDRRSGAAMRCGLLLDVLARHADVHVLHAGWESERRGAVTYESAPPRRAEHLIRRGLAVLARLAGARRQYLPLSWHVDRALDAGFRGQLRRSIARADAVLLEYSFWARLVAPLARARGIPLVLTQHDVLSDQVTSAAWLRRLVFGIEVRALRLADHAVTLSPADQARFAAAGAPSLLIPNPVDGRRLDAPPDADPRATLAGLGIELPAGPFGLFVGAAHPPNLDAVAALRALAPQCPGLAIVVAGSAAPAGLAGGVLALGRVSDAALLALHRAATMALIPLLAGTGSSLKTIEAMGMGLPVLGTTVAFRGLPVTPGINALVEDRLEAWPALIDALLADAPRRAALGEAARALARGHDHRLVLPAYLPLLGIGVAEAGPPAVADTAASAGA